MLWCPGTHSGPHTHCPTAYPCIQAHSQHIAVVPYTSHIILMNLGPGRHVSAPQHVWTTLPSVHLEHPQHAHSGPTTMFLAPPMHTQCALTPQTCCAARASTSNTQMNLANFTRQTLECLMVLLLSSSTPQPRLMHPQPKRWVTAALHMLLPLPFTTPSHVRTCAGGVIAQQRVC